MKTTHIFLMIALILIVSACAHAPRKQTTSNGQIDSEETMSSPPHQADVKFKCDNGQTFSIAFAKSLNDAILVFDGQDDDEEILDSARVASGIEYNNENYAFREHKGVTTLVDLTQGEEKASICKKVFNKQ